ncbi:MAG: hypothetical protein ACT6R0_09845 [Flavobacterium sp.]|uniref:hypothetical protein n=1 Tax=Flavobacterium sp. TaxID=239 RepID=UPI004033AA0A
MSDFEMKRIPFEVAFKKMREAGMDVSPQEALLIIDFLHNLTYLALRKHFKLP